MTEAITDYLVGLFQGSIPKELIIFIISMFPVLELRGGMIAAKLLDVELLKAFVICYLGNILPIPFILLFIRRIFQFLKRFNKIGGLIEKLEVRSMRKSEKVKRWRNWGLLAFVAIPLPGTGGWTGALIAAFRKNNQVFFCRKGNFHLLAKKSQKNVVIFYIYDRI